MGPQAELVTIRASDGGEFFARLALPEQGGGLAAGRAAGVLVVNGRGEPRPGALEPVLARLAAAGFAALAPDLGAREARAPGDRRALADLERALAELGARPGIDPACLGLLGLGAGAARAFLLACTSSTPAAVVVAGGPLVHAELSRERPWQPLELALNLGAPLLALFGERDPAVPAEHRERLRRSLEAFAREHEIATWPEAGADLLECAPGAGESRAGGEAWERALSFLHRTCDPGRLP